MSTPEPNKPSSSPFTKLDLYFQSCMAYIVENKNSVAWILLSLILVFSASIFWMAQSSKKAIENTLKANALVTRLRSPIVGEKQAPLPSSQNIKTTLSASKDIEKKYNGILLEEAIVANQTDAAFTTFQKMSLVFPMQEWPWKEVGPLTELLEAKNYDKALTSIQLLLKSIQQKKKEPLFRELVGYLHLMEGYCLKELNKPESQSSIQFDTWKKTYPDLAKQLLEIATIEK